jgi:drug/metabolite transporter (DMT)-like permease
MAALCVLSANGWVLTQAWPSELAWPFAACIHYALIGVVGLATVAIRRKRKDYSVWQIIALAAAGLCLFVVPTTALELAAGKVSEFISAAVFCAVPLLTVLAANAFGSDALPARGMMMPALAGLAGAALLFPIDNPGSLRRWLFLGLVIGSCIVVAVASVWMHRLMQGVGVAAAVPAIGLVASAALGLYGASIGWPGMGAKVVAGELLRCVALDLPEVWLLVWLMREVTPSRLSARFLLVPLVTVLEGYAVERGTLGWRVALALGLLCAGGVMLLVKDEPDEVPGLRLR